MAVIADIMSVYVLVIRGDIKILAFILSDKIIYYKSYVAELWKLDDSKNA